jgi:glucose-1-phosphate adenylyltransferase
VFDTQALIDIVSPGPDSAGHKDVGGDVIPALTNAGLADLYDFSTNIVPGQRDHERGYWRDVGTLDAYFEATMDLLAPLPLFSLHNREWPVYSVHSSLPPAKLAYGPNGLSAQVTNSLISPGAIVSGGRVDGSIIGSGVYVHESAVVTESILLPGVIVGPGARIHRAVLDKNNVVPERTTIGMNHENDIERFTLSDKGIAFVAKDQMPG